jgi:hypothetical protein
MNVRRKCADLLNYFNPFAAILRCRRRKTTLSQREKRPWLQASTSISTAEDADTVVDAHTGETETVTTASPNDTGTVCVAPADVVTVVAASLPSAGASVHFHLLANGNQKKTQS